MTSIDQLHRQTRDVIGEEDNLLFVPKSLNEKVRIHAVPTVVETNTIGTSFILGHPTNGIMDTSPILLGDHDGAVIQKSVENYNNLFYEPFYTNYFIDDTSSGTIVSNDYQLLASQTFTSKPIFYDSTSTRIVQTFVLSSTVTSGSVSFWAKTENGSYQEAANNAETTLTSPGSSLIIQIRHVSGTALIDKYYVQYAGVNF